MNLRSDDPAQWQLTPTEAVTLQRHLAPRVLTDDRFGTIRYVAGIDAGVPASGTLTRMAVVVMSFPDLEVLEEIVVERPTRFPYVPGLLSFREVPVMLDALANLAVEPDVVFCDGHGLAHPRRIGSASHLGLAAGIPTVGAAKSCLVGRFDDPGERRGDWSLLAHRAERIGAVLRTRSKVRPVLVSSDHCVGLTSAINLALDCAPRFRLPESIRAADKLASS